MNRKTFDKYKLIMTKDELKRIKTINLNGNWTVSLDLHSLSTHRAKVLAQNFLLLTPPGMAVIIHGYKHGDSIKRAISNDLASRKIVRREVPEYNPGITIFELAA